MKIVHLLTAGHIKTCTLLTRFYAGGCSSNNAYLSTVLHARRPVISTLKSFNK